MSSPSAAAAAAVSGLMSSNVNRHLRRVNSIGHLMSPEMALTNQPRKYTKIYWKNSEQEDISNSYLTLLCKATLFCLQAGKERAPHLAFSSPASSHQLFVCSSTFFFFFLLWIYFSLFQGNQQQLLWYKNMFSREKSNSCLPCSTYVQCCCCSCCTLVWVNLGDLDFTRLGTYLIATTNLNPRGMLAERRSVAATLAFHVQHD
jgi:hypothetical protein